MADQAQNFENHAKLVPLYHFVVTPILAINALWALWLLFTAPSFATVMGLLVAASLVAIFLFVRLFPLTVQDRLIRLEETLRMREILPQDLRGRIGELRRQQFVALRFAPDEELPGLVAKVLAGELKTGKEIKQSIKNWRADHLRM